MGATILFAERRLAHGARAWVARRDPLRATPSSPRDSRRHMRGRRAPTAAARSSFLSTLGDAPFWLSLMLLIHEIAVHVVPYLFALSIGTLLMGVAHGITDVLRRQLVCDAGEGAATRRGERHGDHRIPRLQHPHQHLRVGVTGVAANRFVAIFSFEIQARHRVGHDSGRNACSRARDVHGLTELGGGSDRQSSHITSNAHKVSRTRVRQTEAAQATRSSRGQQQSKQGLPSTNVQAEQRT